MKFSSANLLLALIVLLFLFTRLYKLPSEDCKLCFQTKFSSSAYKLSEIPPSVYWDEASIGYNAYSIAQTGRDEWGEFLPLHFRAFGEFKLPVYIYATVPSIVAFGLNAFAVRLPAVLFSLGVVVLTYFLARKLSGSPTVGLLSSFFVSISPWFFIFSRTGYEVTAGLMFYLLAIYLFLQNNRNLWYIFFSTLSFILSVYSYNSFRIVVPLTILLLVVCYLRTLINAFKKDILPLTLSIIFVALSIIPIYRLYVYDAGISRLQAVGTTSTSFIKNYFSHFSPDFLILNGDKNLRSQQLGSGQLSLPELVFLLLGFLFIIRSRKKYYLLVLVLLLLGPIPAALTKESPHALRAISMAPFISIISAEGVFSLWRFVKNKYLLYLLVVAISLGFFLNYFLNFLNTYPIQSSKDWQFGYQQAVDFVNKKIFTGYDRVIISDEYAQPYIFALFYLKYDPNQFRQGVTRNSVDQWGFSTVSSFGKFEFGKVEKLLNIKSGHSLIFASNEEEISTLTPIGTIKFLDGSTAFWIYEQ